MINTDLDEMVEVCITVPFVITVTLVVVGCALDASVVTLPARDIVLNLVPLEIIVVFVKGGLPPELQGALELIVPVPSWAEAVPVMVRVMMEAGPVPEAC